MGAEARLPFPPVLLINSLDDSSSVEGRPRRVTRDTATGRARRLGREAIAVLVVYPTIVVGGGIDILEPEQLNRLLLLRDRARFRRGNLNTLHVLGGDRAEEGDGRETGAEATPWWVREDGDDSGWR